MPCGGSEDDCYSPRCDAQLPSHTQCFSQMLAQGWLSVAKKKLFKSRYCILYQDGNFV
jgi:hypothetical protein